MLIGARSVTGANAPFRALDPREATVLEPVFFEAGAEDVARACVLADAAADDYRELALDRRGAFLDAIANGILGLGDVLIERAMAETGLPRPRLEGERARTVNQLRLFAEVVRSGSWMETRHDGALPERKPLPRPELWLRHIAVGPVAVFGASNFPLAFSVAGGDTAAALAAGCPVVVKAHPAHPGTSELIGRTIQATVAELGLPEGVFSLLTGAGNAVGTMLVADPHIKAVGFTGSRRGGLALASVAAARPAPIPVYAEMSSINPVLLLPGALAERGPEIAQALVASLTLGAGQFCTNPGLLLAIGGSDLDRFIDACGGALAAIIPAPMLTPAIAEAYRNGVEKLNKHAGVDKLAGSAAATGANAGAAALFATDAAHFLADPALHEEVFGASTLLLRCADAQQFRSVIDAIEGQLTITLQMATRDQELASALLPRLERKAGRILVNEMPTGVEVASAMVHGGPYPATTDGRSTSVGTLAIRRFLRPVCYQNFPDALLPPLISSLAPV
jgi:NADP-dependent aldehyde dehydrogenase